MCGSSRDQWLVAEGDGVSLHESQFTSVLLWLCGVQLFTSASVSQSSVRFRASGVAMQDYPVDWELHQRVQSLQQTRQNQEKRWALPEQVDSVPPVVSRHACFSPLPGKGESRGSEIPDTGP